MCVCVGGGGGGGLSEVQMKDRGVAEIWLRDLSFIRRGRAGGKFLPR